MAKTTNRLASALIGMAACLTASPALAGAATTPNSQAQVLESIQFAVLLDMDFGRIALRDTVSGGDVVVDPASSSRSCTANIVCAGTWGVSRLELSGSDAGVQVNFDPTFELTGPGDPIQAEPNFPGGPGTVVQLTGGFTVVNFGATLHINPGQAPGVYSGQFTVNLEYN
ncbi:MAG: DUF4402 domain-containing protein [Novosphingobium sp.]|uniref:DUF4402 domain-containing protein n=1 Tax=Novosphingobium sp. TaxID=1874826 RepID=UPI0032BC31F2